MGKNVRLRPRTRLVFSQYFHLKDEVIFHPHENETPSPPPQKKKNKENETQDETNFSKEQKESSVNPQVRSCSF